MRRSHKNQPPAKNSPASNAHYRGLLHHCAALGVLGCCAAQVANAEIEEILITAPARTEALQELDMAANSFTAEHLRELNAWQHEAIANQATNVELYSGATLQSFTIRGIGSNEFNANFNTPVAIQFDEVYMNKPWMSSTPLFDITQADVLKGPQGVSFGRNTTGGVVNYYRNAPSRELDAGVEVSADNFDRYGLEGFLNGPLGEHLSGRASVWLTDSSGGPYDNQLTGEEVGESRQTMARVQLLWDYDATRIKWLAHGGRDKSEPVPYKGPGLFLPGGELCPQALTGENIRDRDACSKFAGLAPDPAGEIEPQDITTINQDYWPEQDNTSLGSQLRLEHDTSLGSLVSITAYEYFERDEREDTDSSMFVSANTDWNAKINQVTQEFRFLGSLGTDWDYLIGAFYLDESLEQNDSSDFTQNPLGILPPTSPILANDFDQDVESFAVFLHNDWTLPHQLTASFGLRWTTDKTSLDGSTFLAADDPTQTVPVDALDDSRRDNDISVKAGLKWSPTATTMLYGKYSTAYRAGGYNVPLGGVITPFDPEDVEAYELGFKSRLLDNTLQFNAATFYYDYDDVQVNVDDPQSPLVPITRNIGESRHLGFELDTRWMPTERWDMRAGIGYLNAEYRNTDATISTYAGPISLEGKTPINTPSWSFNGFVGYTRPIPRQWQLTVSSDFSWTDERYLEATNQAFDQAESFWLVNARAALLSPDQRWELAIWVKNLTDEGYLTYMNNLAFTRLDVYGAPRSFGASLQWRL